MATVPSGASPSGTPRSDSPPAHRWELERTPGRGDSHWQREPDIREREYGERLSLASLFAGKREQRLIYPQHQYRVSAIQCGDECHLAAFAAHQQVNRAERRPCIQTLSPDMVARKPLLSIIVEQRDVA